MISMLCRNRVADYTKWKSVFDGEIHFVESAS